MKLENKVALVTGASSGIGKETAIMLARKGCRVAVTHNKNSSGGQEVLEECRKHGDAILLQLDVADAKSVEEAAGEVIKKFGRIDLLVNNAGVVVWKDLKDQSVEDIDRQLQANLSGLIKMTRALMPQFYGQKEGIIINVSSGAGKQGYGGLSVYCASKFGVRGFTQALSAELPEGIRIYCVNPGMTATRMTNYKGIPPEKVAEVIVNATEENLGKKSGDDVDVWEYAQ